MDFIALEISNAILSALKNGDINVLERMNFIYKDKIISILEKMDIEKNSTDSSDLSGKNKINVIDNTKSVMISFNNN
jgi:hypothetical protein